MGPRSTPLGASDATGRVLKCGTKETVCQRTLIKVHTLTAFDRVIETDKHLRAQKMDACEKVCLGVDEKQRRHDGHSNPVNS